MADKCFYCGCDIYPHGSRALALDEGAKKTRDHIVPVMMGSAYLTANNVVPCCADCNNVKTDAPAEVFMYFLRNFKPRTPIKERRLAFKQFCYSLTRVGLVACLKDCAENSQVAYAPMVKPRGKFTKRDLMKGR